VHRQRLTLPTPKGPVAWSPKSWGDEFEVLFFGEGEKRPPFDVAGRFAVVSICGVLTQRESWWGDDYGAIKSRVAQALASEQPEVLLRLDSPGGDFAGCLDLARELRTMAAAAGKPLVAFTDRQAASAAYALASAASEIVVTDSAMVGSIGVWAPLIDQTALDKAMGLNIQIAASGTAKSDRNPHVAITDDSFARLLAQVNDMAGLFFELVSEHRGLAVSRVKAQEGAEFLGARAVAVGFADRIATFDQLVSGNSQGTPKMSKYDEALGAMRRAADGDDEDAKKAKKCLKAWDDSEKEEDPDKGKAEGDKDEKKDDEKKDDKEAKAAAAAGSNRELALAEEVARLKAKDAARDAAEAKAKEDVARAELFAKRPDFSDAQKATLALVPLAALERAVKEWPRANADPMAAANALTPVVSGGEKKNGFAPNLSPEQRTLLERTDPNATARGPKAARMVGTALEMPAVALSQQDIDARLAELQKEAV
jgi:ClpP class serine protease